MSIEYMKKAQEAGEIGAHVAAIMYYRNAAEQGEEGAVKAAVSYAEALKKPADQLAVYEWALEKEPTLVDKIREIRGGE